MGTSTKKRKTMIEAFWRIDKWSVDRFRSIESHGPVWRIEHFFLRPEDIVDPWIKAQQPLDLSLADYRFKDKPKSKKIPQLTVSAGQIYIEAGFYENFLQSIVKPCVTAMPCTISDKPYYILRPDVALECIDFERSEWRQNDFGVRYAWPRLVLKDVPENAPPVFLSGFGREYWEMPVFSDTFVRACQINKIIGADFVKVYPLNLD